MIAGSFRLEGGVFHGRVISAFAGVDRNGLYVSGNGAWPVSYTHLATLCRELDAGEPTVRDSLVELSKPGRDPRDELPKPLLRNDILELKDLQRGMELKGTVRNIVDFGAFIDIGVHEDGLCHISQICSRYIRHPLEVLNVGDIVTVWVLDVDSARKRIALTMKGKPSDQ